MRFFRGALFEFGGEAALAADFGSGLGGSGSIDVGGDGLACGVRGLVVECGHARNLRWPIVSRRVWNGACVMSLGAERNFLRD